MNKFLILIDNRGYVASSLLPGARQTINCMLLKKNLEKRNCQVEIKQLHELTFPTKYQGWYAIYPSSEDPGLFYKSFIEDILLRLQMDGVILLPRFECFRAHHNKVFMELFRTSLCYDELKTLKSYFFYSIKDLKHLLKTYDSEMKYPIVIKTAQGAGSVGVALVHSREELLKKAEKMGKISYNGIIFSTKDKIRSTLGSLYRKSRQMDFLEKAKPREKLILQSFLPDLKHDYKVLIFGEKYYLLRRKVREHDFRASGSGKLEFPDKLTSIEEQVLDLAYKGYEAINTPLLSLDIAHDGTISHMLELQCMNFGPYTLQFSNGFYQKKQGQWDYQKKKSILEEEIAEAVTWYIENKRN